MSDNKEETVKAVRYSVLVSGDGDVYNRIAGTREFVENTLLNMGAPFKWSDSKQDFIHVSKMHDLHLVNSIKEDITFVNSMEDLQAFLNSALLGEYYNRIEE